MQYRSNGALFTGNHPWYRIGSGVELFLNFAWVLLAALMLWLWLRYASCAGPGDRRMQLVSLAVLILILFPVISVTDDLQAIQNPAEADCCLRRDHAISNAHSIVPAVAELPMPFFAKPSFGFVRLAAPDRLNTRVVDHPGLTAILNRPPPAA